MEAAATGRPPEPQRSFSLFGQLLPQPVRGDCVQRPARQRGLAWRAESRGLAVAGGKRRPDLALRLEGLKARGLEAGADGRFPLQVTAADLSGADLIVAVKEAEHRPLLASCSPSGSTGRVLHIHDSTARNHAKRLAVLEDHLQSLVQRLAGADV